MQKIISIVIATTFIITPIRFSSYAYARSLDQVPGMPKPGDMVHVSPEFNPAHLVGVIVHPNNAFHFDFLINRGERPLSDLQKRKEYNKLVKYFLASLTIPDEDQWVNLSPYEKNRIIKDNFGKTEMGRDLLVQDYILKQIVSSLIYPEERLGKEFWNKVYERAKKEYGSADMSVNTFNKVWIIPDEAVVYESGSTAYILRNHLKVMLEQDYLALQKQLSLTPSLTKEGTKGSSKDISTLGSQILRSIVIPILEKEVNTAKNFANLRQIYSGMILAAWYKHALKKSLLGKIYADKAKVKGVDQDPRANEAIYRQYLRAFKKGVFNYIKEDVDRYTHETIARKYFSGGTEAFTKGAELNPAQLTPGKVAYYRGDLPPGIVSKVDFAVLADTGKIDKASVALVSYDASGCRGLVIGTDNKPREISIDDLPLYQGGPLNNIWPLSSENKPFIQSMIDDLKTKLKQAKQANFSDPQKTALLGDLTESLDGFEQGYKIGLFGADVAFLHQETPILTISYTEAGVRHIALFDELLKFYMSEETRRWIIERMVLRHVINFVGEARAIKAFGDKEVLVSEVAPMAFWYEGPILLDVVNTPPIVLSSGQKLFFDREYNHTDINTNPVSIYKNTQGDRYFVKEISDPARVVAEQVGFTLFKLLGLPVPSQYEAVQLGKGKLGIAVPYVKDFQTIENVDLDKLTRENQRLIEMAYYADSVLETWDRHGGNIRVYDDQGIQRIEFFDWDHTLGFQQWDRIFRDKFKPSLTYYQRERYARKNDMYSDKTRDRPVSGSTEFIEKLLGIRSPFEKFLIEIQSNPIFSGAFTDKPGTKTLGRRELEEEFREFFDSLQGPAGQNSSGANHKADEPSVQQPSLKGGSDVGGIDLNAADLNLLIKRDGKGVPLPIDKQDMERLMRAKGFVPTIIEIKPVGNLPIISQLQQKFSRNWINATR